MSFAAAAVAGRRTVVPSRLERGHACCHERGAPVGGQAFIGQLQVE
jgi:hypothetical protein